MGFWGFGVFTKVKRGVYPAKDCVQAYIRYQIALLQSKQSTSRPVEQNSQGIDAETERWTRLRADKEELKVLQLTGELGRVDDIRKEYEDEAVQIRSTLLSIIPRTLSLLPTPKTPREKEIFYRDIIRKELESVSRDRT